MPIVTRTMPVAAPPYWVINYLKDFANAEDWDAGTQRCRRNDAGPIKAGSSWLAEVGSIVTYRADLTMHGAAKLLNLIMKLAFDRSTNDTEKQMTKVLDGLSAE